MIYLKKKKKKECLNVLFLLLFLELVYAICDSSCHDSSEGTLSKGILWSWSSTVLDVPNVKQNSEDDTRLLKSSISYGHTIRLMVLMSAPGMSGMFL